MKRILISIILLFALSGCSTANKTMRIIQNFEGSGSITVTTKLGSATAIIEEGKKEDGKYTAKKIDIVINGGILGTKIEIHAEPYSRPLIEK